MNENQKEVVKIEKMKIVVDTSKNQYKTIDEIITNSKKTSVKTKKKSTNSDANKKKKYVKKDSKKTVKQSNDSKQK